jgi:hypothetical protein
MRAVAGSNEDRPWLPGNNASAVHFAASSATEPKHDLAPMNGAALEISSGDTG